MFRQSPKTFIGKLAANALGKLENNLSKHGNETFKKYGKYPH